MSSKSKRKAGHAKGRDKGKDEAHGLRTVHEWLFDYFAMISDTKMMEVLADVATRKVETFAEARAHVNLRIDMMISWLDNTRPSPSFVYEPDAWQQWIKAQGKKLPSRLKQDLQSRALANPEPAAPVEVRRNCCCRGCP